MEWGGAGWSGVGWSCHEQIKPSWSSSHALGFAGTHLMLSVITLQLSHVHMSGLFSLKSTLMPITLSSSIMWWPAALVQSDSVTGSAVMEMSLGGHCSCIALCWAVMCCLSCCRALPCCSVLPSPVLPWPAVPCPAALSWCTALSCCPVLFVVESPPPACCSASLVNTLHR